MVSKKKVKSKNGVRFDSKHIRLRTGESEKDNGTYATQIPLSMQKSVTGFFRSEKLWNAMIVRKERD